MPPEEPEKETELKLKSLIIKGVNTDRELVDLTYTPEFSEEIYNYEMEIENDIESLTIEALAKEEGTIVEILGNENLVVGENVITIMIKTTDEEKSATYQIVVNRKEPDIAEAIVATPEELPEDISKSDYWMLIAGGAGLIVVIIGIIVIITINRRKNPVEEDLFTQEEVVDGFKDTKKDKKKEENDEEDFKRKGKGRHF